MIFFLYLDFLVFPYKNLVDCISYILNSTILINEKLYNFSVYFQFISIYENFHPPKYTMTFSIPNNLMLNEVNKGLCTTDVFIAWKNAHTDIFQLLCR